MNLLLCSWAVMNRKYVSFEIVLPVKRLVALVVYALVNGVVVHGTGVTSEVVLTAKHRTAQLATEVVLRVHGESDGDDN